MGTVGAIGMYILMRLPNGIEYKFAFCGAVYLAPLTGAGLDPVLRRWPRCRWALALLVPLVLAPFMMSSVVADLPAELEGAPRVDEGTYCLSLDSSDEHAIWTRAVRDATAADTVLVVNDPALVFSVFTNRSLYIIGFSESIAGYGIDIEENLLEIRGYPPALYKERLRLIERLYVEDDAAALAACFAELERLQRPIAIHFSRGQGSAFLRWLKEEGIGHELVDSGDHLVWYVDRTGATFRQSS
jgi:hypothetical protein